MGLYGNTRSGVQSELRSHPWAASDSAGASGLAACPRPAGWLPPDRLHVSGDQRLGPLPQPWVPVPAALCSAVQRLSGACVQSGLSRTPTSSRRPLPGGHSHQSSARETLSSRAPPVDSASAAGCSAPRSSGLGCWPLTSVCWQMLSTPSSEETGVRPCPGVHVAPLVSCHCGFSAPPRVPPASGSEHVSVSRTQWPLKSWQHLLPPPPPPSPSHFSTCGPRWGQPGTQDKRHRPWKSHQLAYTRH